MTPLNKARSNAFAAVVCAVALMLAAPGHAACTKPADAKARIAQTLSDINAYRKAAGLPALSTNGDLAKSAQGHACDMASMGKFSHFGSNGSDLVRRIKEQGYRFRAAVENVGKFRASTSAAGWWFKSSGHKDNLLSPKITQVGLGVALGPDQQLYWVMNGASPK